MLSMLLILDLVGWSPMGILAGCIGTTEPALKLLISILMGYFYADLLHKYVGGHPTLKNLFFVTTGIDMAIYNFGSAFIHSLIPAVVMYLTNVVLGPGKINCIITFVFNMTYLLIGYVLTESEDYDITWTMPHCVLTLKLIALSFDLWDGEMVSNGEKISENNKDSAITEDPSLIELLGFVYFPACFLVGPIFSFKRYSDFINDRYTINANVKRTCESEGLKRLIQGLLYLVAYQVGVTIFNVNYMLSDEFWEISIIYRHIYCGLWAHFTLYKYISCWLLTEAACIRFHIAINGYEISEDGTEKKLRVDGCNNIKLHRFETATKFQHYIDSFNCNTNSFAAKYIFKRLKFLGNRNLSQFLTLLFLALWHGVKPGYYVTFFNEFIIIFMEKELEAIISKTEIYHKLWDNTCARYFLYILLKMYTIIFMGWSLVPFDLKVFTKWWRIYYSLYFSGFIIFLPWGFVYKPLLKWAFKLFQVKQRKELKTN